MKKKLESKNWDTFLRIPNPPTTDAAPVVDEEWLTSRGAYSSAPLVIAMLQNEVSPLIRKLQRLSKLDWFFFLVHDRNSGVPTTPDDFGAYIHLRLVFRHNESKFTVAKLLPKVCALTTPVVDGDSFGGVDPKTMVGGVREARRLIGYQSDFVLRLIEAHKKTNDPIVTIKQVRQYLHYFANMTQIKVVG